MSLFGIKDGLRIYGSSVNTSILNGSADPSEGAGVTAVSGSLYLRENGISYKKTGPTDTDWQPYSEVDGTTALTWSTISGATSASANNGYVLASGTYTVTMPGSPNEGDRVGFAGLGDLESNNVTIDFNGNNMNGSSDNLTVDLNYCYFYLLYTGDTSTGWVLSNTDESGDVDDIQSFIGNDDNTDAAVTEFTEQNYITSGDSLEDAIDKLDQALYSTTISGATTSGVEALESFTGSAGASLPTYSSSVYIGVNDDLETAVGSLDSSLSTLSGSITNVDTAHDNLASAVLYENNTSVSGTATNAIVDTATQSGTLGFKWFVVAYDGGGNRMASEIYVLHDGSTNADLTEYAILTIGTTLDVDFDVTADGTDLSLTVDNNDASSVNIKTQRTTIQTSSVDTTAVIN